MIGVEGVAEVDVRQVQDLEIPVPGGDGIDAAFVVVFDGAGIARDNGDGIDVGLGVPGLPAQDDKEQDKDRRGGP